MRFREFSNWDGLKRKVISEKEIKESIPVRFGGHNH